MEIVVASNNRGKVLEIKALLSQWKVHCIAQSDFHLKSVPETGDTFVDNALIKARYAAQKTGLIAVSDDSGLCVDALHGAPGVFSARYAGEDATDEDRMQAVLSALSGVPEGKRTAHFHCAMALSYPDLKRPCIVVEGRWPGHILHEPQGTHGFGYDPIFYVADYACSSAQLPSEIKNKISHRARAFSEFERACAEAGVMR
jgi:XTP/dITP diphosphohydrolase